MPETDVGLLGTEPGGERFFETQTDFGGGLRSKRDESQEREAALACEWLNRMQARGRPQSYAVS